jgi:hypothetical protein
MTMSANSIGMPSGFASVALVHLRRLQAAAVLLHRFGHLGDHEHQRLRWLTLGLGLPQALRVGQPVDWGGRPGTVRHSWSEVGARFVRVAGRAVGEE